ncbi:DUF6151 family protein [Hasllibacter sp. MH4015]|uniref:DUF6151 family protein n=1 Tax=Hasllibacter sp. MH4015 TaxID=2854029 RepID=UPI001CD38014|nr:DUF6151 family protein [Hasllibacter sp. MH4015]
MAEIAWSCRCGAMHGRLTVGAKGGTHVICHCDSCVRAQRHFGQSDTTRLTGVGIFQTVPDLFTIDAGAEHLALAQLSPRGSYRWYASCCDSQIGITGKTAKFPFVAVVDARVAEPERLGPTRARVNVPQTGGGEKSTGVPRAVLALLGRSAGALMSGRWKQTPFFDVKSGQAVATAEVLPKGAGRG